MSNRLTPERLAALRANNKGWRDVEALLDEIAESWAERDQLHQALDASRKMVFADGREPTENERHLFNLLTWREGEARDLAAERDAAKRTVELAAQHGDKVIAQRDRAFAALTTIRKRLERGGWAVSGPFAAELHLAITEGLGES